MNNTTPHTKGYLPSRRFADWMLGPPEGEAAAVQVAGDAPPEVRNA